MRQNPNAYNNPVTTGYSPNVPKAYILSFFIIKIPFITFNNYTTNWLVYWQILDLSITLVHFIQTVSLI
jgi:hypothetical protein